MSYAIIRHKRYKRKDLTKLYRHNERKNTSYTNKDIDITKSYLNYHLKDIPDDTYVTAFDKTKKDYNLKGQVKEVSNIMCEYVITSNTAFFNAIGEDEEKRFFNEAYNFVASHKNLGEENIISAVVHKDEKTPHMHIFYIPVVDSLDKNKNPIRKIACSEFWKDKDSYLQLQDNYYSYITSKGFNLERGQSSARQHLSVEDYKLITNYDISKKALQDIEIKLPDVPDIKEITRLTTRRDEIIQKEIIEPKDNLIKHLHSDNVRLYRELERQVNIIDKAEKYEKERTTILAQNKDFQSRCEVAENEYEDRVFKLNKNHDNKLVELENEFKEKTVELEKNYNAKTIELEKEVRKDYRKLERENAHLTRVIDTLKDTVTKFINWVCNKFAINPVTTIRDFEKENNIYLDPERQIEKEEQELEWDMEM